VPLIYRRGVRVALEGVDGTRRQMHTGGMPVWVVASERPQKASPIDGAKLRHLRRRCPWLMESAGADVLKPDNSEALRRATARCEHPICWAATRRDEGDSPFGCAECGTTEFGGWVQRDEEGRYRLCKQCFALLSKRHRGSSDAVQRAVFAPIEAKWEVARRYPKRFRSGAPDCCERCGTTGPVEAHHRDGNRRNNAVENREWLCPSCHRDQPHDRTSYRDRNLNADVAR
jgi:hypothetical protein